MIRPIILLVVPASLFAQAQPVPTRRGIARRAGIWRCRVEAVGNRDALQSPFFKHVLNHY